MQTGLRTAKPPVVDVTMASSTRYVRKKAEIVAVGEIIGALTGSFQYRTSLQSKLDNIFQHGVHPKFGGF